MKKALEDIDGTLKAQRCAAIPPPSSPEKDLTFGIHATGDGRNAMGNSIVYIEGNTVKVDDKEYELTLGLRMLILFKKPRPQHCTNDHYSVYKAIVAQTRVRAYPNKRTGSALPRSTWKWKHMLSGMAIPGDSVGEEDVEGSDGYRTPPDFMPTSGTSPPPFTGKTRKRRKTREPFYKAYRVVYLPGDIRRLTDKLHLLLAEFFSGYTTVRNELVYVLDALLRLKQLTRREYTEISNRLASTRLYTDVLQLEDMSCRYSWITSCPQCSKGHVGYSCKGSVAERGGGGVCSFA